MTTALICYNENVSERPDSIKREPIIQHCIEFQKIRKANYEKYFGQEKVQKVQSENKSGLHFH